jgi:hypothetical protein
MSLVRVSRPGCYFYSLAPQTFVNDCHIVIVAKDLAFASEERLKLGQNSYVSGYSRVRDSVCRISIPRVLQNVVFE